MCCSSFRCANLNDPSVLPSCQQTGQSPGRPLTDSGDQVQSDPTFCLPTKRSSRKLLQWADETKRWKHSAGTSPIGRSLLEECL